MARPATTSPRLRARRTPRLPSSALALSGLATALLCACTAPDAPLAEGLDVGLGPDVGRAAPGDAGDAGPDHATGRSDADTGTDRPLSFLFILTDDQRADSLWTMPETTELLGGDNGVQFERAYVNTPLCCPARASIAAGGFLAMDTGVLMNEAPNGGNGRFDDTRSLAVHLQGAGYRTAMIGKYVHGVTPRYVAPGWDWWVRTSTDEDWSDFEVAIGSSDESASEAAPLREVERYVTDYVTAEARQVIEEVGDEPFFIWLNHSAPHYPATPDEADAGTYADETWRGGAWDEADVSDKPAFFDTLPPLSDDIVAEKDEFYRNALETLISVDRSVTTLVEALDEAGRLEDTVIIFASDNGMLWGEHRVYNKGMPWEEAVRVPLLIRAPGGRTGAVPQLVSVSTDVPATILDLAGIDAPTGGESLAPFLTGTPGDWRSSLFLEGYAGATVPTFSTVVEDRWKYTWYITGDEELYDLDADPYEERSLHDSLLHRGVRDRLAAEVEATQGIALDLPDASFTRGMVGEVHLVAQAGTPPITWTAATDLPDGLALDKDGRLHGKPTEAGSFPVQIRAQGSRVRAHDENFEDHYAIMNIQVSEPGGRLPAAEPPRLEARAGPPGPGGRDTAVVEVHVPAPPGVPVTVDLSGAGDLDDAHHRAARGPDPVLRIDELRPDTTYTVRVRGPAGDVRRTIRTPAATP